MKEIKAPNDYDINGVVTLFEAGSIEMGAAENWQVRLAKELSDIENLLVLNPRRDDWDSTWKQSKDDSQFRGQVLWELQAQESADVIAMYFDPKTKSPITLMELGLFVDNSLVVFCPEGFYRKGNVDIVCERYGASQASSWDEFVEMVRARIKVSEVKKLEDAWK